MKGRRSQLLSRSRPHSKRPGINRHPRKGKGSVGYSQDPNLLPSMLVVRRSIFLEWAMLGSNQRPLPCEGKA